MSRLIGGLTNNEGNGRKMEWSMSESESVQWSGGVRVEWGRIESGEQFRWGGAVREVREELSGCGDGGGCQGVGREWGGSKGARERMDRGREQRRGGEKRLEGGEDTWWQSPTKGRKGDDDSTRACEDYTLKSGHHWKMAYKITSWIIITTCLPMFEWDMSCEDNYVGVVNHQCNLA